MGRPLTRNRRQRSTSSYPSLPASNRNSTPRTASTGSRTTIHIQSTAGTRKSRTTLQLTRASRCRPLTRNRRQCSTSSTLTLPACP